VTSTLRLWILLPFAAATLSACLSSGPPAPPVRWFDPTASFGPAERATPVSVVFVRGQPHLVQDIAVRTSPTEVAFDTEHRWLMPPEEILRRAFVRQGVPIDPTGRLVELTVFELQRIGDTAAARAACRVHAAAGSPHPADEYEVVVPATDSSLEALTQAMGQAMQSLADQIR